jgi:hypothetical protein
MDRTLPLARQGKRLPKPFGKMFIEQLASREADSKD